MRCWQFDQDLKRLYWFGDDWLGTGDKEMEEVD